MNVLKCKMHHISVGKSNEQSLCNKFEASFKAFHILATTKSAEKKHFNANESITKKFQKLFQVNFSRKAGHGYVFAAGKMHFLRSNVDCLLMSWS